MNWLARIVARAWQRRRIRRDFARIRTELEAIERSVSRQPWWGELPRD